MGNLHCHSLPINQLCFAPSGNELITASNDRQIKVWSGHLGQPLGAITNPHYGQATSVAFSPGGDQVAVGYHDGMVRVFDARSLTLDLEVSCHEKRVGCLKFGRFNLASCIITGSDDCQVKVSKGGS